MVMHWTGRIVFATLFIVFFSSCSQEPQTFEELEKAGEKAFVDQDYDHARKYLSQAVAQKPSDRHLLYLLSVSYQRDYLYDSAFFYLKRAAMLFPDDREVNLILYQVAKAIGDWKSTIKAIHVLIKTGDPSEQYDRELAELNLEIKNFEVAYYFYRKLLEKEPDNPDNYLKVANLAIELDSAETALHVIDSAIDKFGVNDKFLLNKAMYLIGNGRYIEAEAIFRSLVDKDTSSVAYRINLANCLASQDDRAKKEEAYHLYLNLNPLVSKDFNVDSLLRALEEELNYKK